MEFIAARNYTRTTGRQIDLVVIHTMESPEGVTTAEDVSRWAAGPNAPKVSWHYAVDVNSVVQCVREQDVAWTAPGANHNGIQIELAGRAGQGAAGWSDPYSKSQLALAALLVAEICKRHNIPVQLVNRGGLLIGERGITTHNSVSLAFRRSDHTDPGKDFPMDEFLRMVREAMQPKVLRRWPVPIPAWFWEWAKWRLNNRTGPRPKSAPYLIPPWAWVRLKALLDARK